VPERNCINHHDRPAIGQCFQCHKPLCEECRYDEAAAAGIFCSQACYDQHMAYHGRKQPVIKGSGLKSLVVGLMILAVVALAAIYVGGGKMGLPVLKSLYKSIFGG
jgi:hypothetical protein